LVQIFCLARPLDTSITEEYWFAGSAITASGHPRAARQQQSGLGIRRARIEELYGAHDTEMVQTLVFLKTHKMRSSSSKNIFEDQRKS
jgi:hypothetical protein